MRAPASSSSSSSQFCYVADTVAVAAMNEGSHKVRPIRSPIDVDSTKRNSVAGVGSHAFLVHLSHPNPLTEWWSLSRLVHSKGIPGLRARRLECVA